jgi:hypothetical protein
VEKSQHKPLTGFTILKLAEHRLTVQADMSSKTVHFFLDNELVPAVIRKISDSIRFGVYSNCSSFPLFSLISSSLLPLFFFFLTNAVEFSSSGEHTVTCLEVRKIKSSHVPLGTEKTCKVYYYAGHSREGKKEY